MAMLYTNLDKPVIVKTLSDVEHLPTIPEQITLDDHIGGFTAEYKNSILDYVDLVAANDNRIITVIWSQIVKDNVRKNYKNLNFMYNWDFQYKIGFQYFENFNVSRQIDFKNFVISLNYSNHISRQLLVAALHKQGWFNAAYSSKHFEYANDNIDGLITDILDERADFYRHFFVSDDNFCSFTNSIIPSAYRHDQNIFYLDKKLQQSFVHLISETMATSYQPFITEKFLYSVSTKGLYLAYAQPGWHNHLEVQYGFKPYSKIFDYNFDQIQNSVERLVKLIEMLGKFSNLSKADWHDLYLLELDTIDYNYDHYYGKGYLDNMQKHKYNTLI